MKKCGPDTTPDAFIFSDRNEVAFSTVVESDQVIVTGIEEPVPIDVLGEYSHRRTAGGGYQPEAMVFDPESGLLYYTEAFVFAYDYESSTAVVVSQ